VADKRKKQNVGTMQSIFDFIFAETQKPAEKRRPVKVSNIDGSSELTDALVTVLEKPGLYVADQAMKNLEDALNIQLAEIYTESGVTQKKTKIGTKDLLSIFTDPNAFFDKLYKKSKRKMKLADYAGKSFRGILAASVAKKQGIEDWDDRWAINRAASGSRDPSDRLATITSARRIGRKYLAVDSFAKGCDSAFGSNTSRYRSAIARVGKAIDKANIQNIAEFRSFLERDPSFSGNPDAIDKIVNQYQKKENKFYNSLRGSLADGDIGTGAKSFKDWEDMLHRGFKDKLSRSAPEDMDMFREISSKYYQRKGDIYRLSSNAEDQSQGKAYERMSLLMMNLSRTQGKIIGEVQNNLEKVRGSIRVLKRLGTLNPEQRKELIRLKKTEKGLKAEMSYLRSSRIQDKYYQVKGYWTSMKDIWGKNLGASILDGSFFSADNKILNPINQHELGLHMIGKDRVYFNINGKDNAYCRAMTTVMYLTPKKLLKMDGAYFAYRAYRNRMDSFKKLVLQVKGIGDKGLLESLYKDLETSGLFGVKGTNLLINYDIFNDPVKLKEGIDYLRNKYSNNPNIQKLLDNYLKKEGSLSRLVAIFSVVARLKANIKKKIDEATLKKVREGVANMLLKSFSNNPILESAILSWKNGGHIRGLVNGFVRAFLTSVGIVDPVLQTLVSGVITALLCDVIVKLSKVLSQILVVMVMGIVLILGLGFSFGNSMMQRYSPLSYVKPGEVVECEGFTPILLPWNDYPFEPAVPPPSNSTCPFGDISLHCTQGYIPPRGDWSHSTIRYKKPVDLAFGGSGFYFYAPQYCDQGGCRVTGARPANKYRCLDKVTPAGDEVFFNDGQGNVFIIVHAKALVSINSEVLGGQPVAYIYGGGELPVGSCWSGSHVHLEITHDGQYIDPPSFLQQMGCNVPSENQCDVD